MIPLIRADLALSATEIGALTSFPVVLFGAGALLGSLFISRLGVRRTLIGGLVLVALSAALRGAGWDVLILFGATLIMGVGVAVL